MRISFLGKGGSGKTTMAVSFIKYLNNLDKTVLAVDADINVNLGKALGMQTKFIEDKFAELLEFFEEERIKENKAVIGTIPPSMKSRFISPELNDEFFKKYATFKNNMALITVGTYNDKKIGYACYHSKLGNAFLMYNRLLDDEKFFVVSDATAGIDSVGTSMFYVSDINIFVVEPTKKSIDVFKEFIGVTQKYELKTYVIINKVEDEGDIDFIKTQIDNKYIIGFVKSSKHLKKFEQGNDEELDEFVVENQAINNKIMDLLTSTKKDWNRYLEIEKQVYINDAGDWYSQFYNQNLPAYIDKNFSYIKVIKNEINSKSK